MTDVDRALEADWTGPVETAAVTVHDPAPGVRVLTLVSEPLGVLRQAVKRAIREALLVSEADPGVRVLIVTGSGPGVLGRIGREGVCRRSRAGSAPRRAWTRP